MPTTKINVHVKTKAREPGVSVIDATTLRVRVREAPERGKANEAVVAALADALGVPRSSVRIVTGGHSRKKLVEVGLSPEELPERWELL
jgi:uncharacterized protein YggU (UPF0235/DUF167 family)